MRASSSGSESVMLLSKIKIGKIFLFFNKANFKAVLSSNLKSLLNQNIFTFIISTFS